MSDKNKVRPSMLSSIGTGGVGRTANTNRSIEMQPLYGENEEKHSSSQTPSGGRRMKKIIERFGLSSISALGDARLRLRKRRSKPRKFSVKLPNRFILYFSVFFFFVPLCLGVIVLVRVLLFGSQKEDPEHPLHRKHFTRNSVINSTVVNTSTSPMVDNHFEYTVASQKNSLQRTENNSLGKLENQTNFTEESTLKIEKTYKGDKKRKHKKQNYEGMVNKKNEKQNDEGKRDRSKEKAS